jgi:hypothetical protein
LCQASAVAITALYAAQLLLCFAVRPFTTLFSHLYTMVTLTLTALAALCQAWYLFVDQSDGSAASEALLTAAAVCTKLVSGASVLKSVLDALDVIHVCHRHLLCLWSLLLASTTGDDDDHPHVLPSVDDDDAQGLKLFDEAVGESKDYRDDHHSDHGHDEDEDDDAWETCHRRIAAMELKSNDQSPSSYAGGILTAKEAVAHHQRQSDLHQYFLGIS